MDPVFSTANLDLLVETSRRGAEKSSAQKPDVEEFEKISEFIGLQLAEADRRDLARLDVRLRQEDRKALAWYLNIVRTLSGTVEAGEHIRHLLFIPFQADKALAWPFWIDSSVEEIAGGLETALDLGYGSLELHPETLPFEALEAVGVLDWHRMVTSERLSVSAQPAVSKGGVLVGRWTVPQSDRPRLARKLLHALQLTPELKAWRARTEGLLSEKADGARITVYPAVLLQDVFALVRQIRFSTELEQAARRCANAESLTWAWIEKAGELKWRLANAAGETVEGQSHFPDEPTALVEDQIRRAGQRLRLRLLPPLPG